MKFYHLSQENVYDRILPSSRRNDPNAIVPKVPQQSHGENQSTDRVCVAPSVLQCAASIPRKGRLYIYEIDTEKVTEPLDVIRDKSISNEKWLTDEDIESAGGEIPVTRLGWIDTERSYVGNAFDLLIKIAIHRHLTDAEVWKKLPSEEWVLELPTQPQEKSAHIRAEPKKKLILPGDSGFR